MERSSPDEIRAYHLSELEIAKDRRAPGHVLPPVPDGVTNLLDVGCGAGQSLIGLGLTAEMPCWGVDPDLSALTLGTELDRHIRFAAASAESLPFPDATFDFVFSRVALPYSNIPEAVAEVFRVLRPGGSTWLTLNGPKFAFDPIIRGLKSLNPRLVLYGLYVLSNGLLLETLGRQIAWGLGPRARYESCQTSRGMVRVLRRSGFKRVSVRKDQFLVALARKPGELGVR